MAKRNLTSEEQKLWHLYTRDIKPRSKLDLIQEDKKTRFDIKIPKKVIFKRPAPDTLNNYESLKNNDSNWGKKLKQGKMPIEGKIDLHGMTCVQAHDKLYGFLERAQRNGKRVILIVTGKGGPKRGYADYRFEDFESSLGVLRREVPMWLSGGAMRQMIVSFQDANSRDGGSGALYVVLKRNK